jgi:hypothetical protein
MPARRFFALLSEARIIMARRRGEDCDIAAIAICTADYYTKTAERFKKRELAELGQDAPELAARKQAQLNPAEQANVMRSVFGVKPGTVISGR